MLGWKKYQELKIEVNKLYIHCDGHSKSLSNLKERVRTLEYRKQMDDDTIDRLISTVESLSLRLYAIESSNKKMHALEDKYQKFPVPVQFICPYFCECRVITKEK